MPQPTLSDVHVDQPLTDLSIAFIQSAMGFVANRVFPVVGVQKASDKYFKYPRGYFNRREMQKRAPGTRAAVAGYQIETDNYSTDVWALAKYVDDQIRANYDAALDADREATEYLTLQDLLNREVEWVAAYFTAGDPGDTWTFDVDGDSSASASFDPTDAGNNNVVRWSDYSNSDPLVDIANGVENVLGITGFKPNALTLGFSVWNKLKNHPDIVDRIKGGAVSGAPAIVTRQTVAAMLELDEIHVMEGIQNTADEGQADSHAFIGGKNALLSYRPPSPGLMTPSAGYTFAWTGFTGAGPSGTRIAAKRDDLADSDVFEVQSAWDQKLVSADLGYFFGGIVE